MFIKLFALFFGMLMFAGVVGTASAALDPGVATGFTSLQTDFASELSLAYPVMIFISVALAIFGLFKMFIRKSAGS